MESHLPFEMDDANWPLRASTAKTLCSFEHNSYHGLPQQDSAPGRLAPPHPPSVYSVDDYRSILQTDTSLSEQCVPEDQFMAEATTRELHIAPRLTPRIQLPRLPPQFATQNFPHSVPLSLHNIQSSPSLSSSVTTASSSPSSPEAPSFQRWPFSEVTAQLEPLRTKRHFTGLRPAKRLPHRNSPPWEVHAIIQVSENVPIGTRYDDISDDVQISPDLGVVESLSTNAAPAIDIQPRGLNLGHTDSPTRYFHYRGASFEVLNPHASLIYGTRSFETPAVEIDGLLDDYLDLEEPFEHDMDRSASASTNDGTPSRQLYDDPEVARRNILRLPSQGVAEAGPSQASEQTDDGDRAVSAILADYDHTTYPPTTHRPTSSDSSVTEWLDYVQEARQISPGLPLLEAFAIAKAKGHEFTPRQPRTAAPALSPYDPPTSDRTYGDTNRLLQITPHAIGLTQNRETDQPARPSNPTPDDNTHLTGHNSTHGSIHTGDSPPGADAEDNTDIDNSNATVIVNPFSTADYERQEDNDTEADWVTEAGQSNRERFSLGLEGDDVQLDDFVNSNRVEPGQARVPAPLHRAFRRYEPAEANVYDQLREEEIEHHARTLSTIFQNKFQAMASGENLSIHSAQAGAHRRAAVEAEAELERLRQRSPETHAAAIDRFMARYGPGTVEQLHTVWPDNNFFRGSARSDTPVSENSLEQVIRVANERAAAEEEEAAAAAAATDPFRRTTMAHNENIRHAGLQYSPTADTFATTRPARLKSPSHFAQSRTVSPSRFVTGTSHQLPPPVSRERTLRPGLRAMASMSSQTGLRDLHLTSTPTSNIGCTAQDIQRRPGTPLYPRAMHLAPPGQRRATDTEMGGFNDAPTPFDRTLRAINVDLASRDLMSRHLWNPFALVMIWAGRFDKVIAKETRNVAREVTKDTKIESLKWACLEFSIIVILGSVIAMFVIIGTLAH